jgi:hypothetical protein
MNPLKETPIFRQRPRPEPSPRAKEIIAKIKAAPEQAAPSTLPPAVSDDDKRGMIKAILLAFGAAGIAFSIGGREVKAQDLGGDIDDLIDSITNIEEFMRQLLEIVTRVFAIVPGVPLPPFVLSMIRDILSQLIGRAGDDSFSGDDGVGAVERSFPSDPATVETPNARRAFGETKLAALRARGEEAIQQAAQVTAGQEQVTADEEAIIATVQPENLLSIELAKLGVVGSMSSRLGTLAFTLQALNTLLADPHLERHAEMRLKSWADEQILGPIPEPAPVGILPGGQ